MATNKEVHQKAIKYTACNLIENGISTKSGPGKGIDLILDNGKTVLVRGMSEEIRLALVHGSPDMLTSDYIVIATNLKYTYSRKIYMIATSDAKAIARNMPNRSDGGDDWFIDVKDYQQYRENYEILKL